MSGASPTTTHAYPVSNFYGVTLTVTDSTTSISTTTNLVIPVASSTPLAAFTSSCTGLSCAFNATGSADTGGTITTYNWDFGDGSPAVTLATPTTTHVYAAAGSGYNVTLTVTDNLAATNSISHNVAPVGSPPPSTPVAVFTSNCTLLSCAFTDASTDTGGTITGYSWNFGDGSSVSTSQNPTHVYASGGTYSVFVDGDRQPG